MTETVGVREVGWMMESPACLELRAEISADKAGDPQDPVKPTSRLKNSPQARD